MTTIKIRAIMQANLITVRPDAPVRQAIELLINNRISGLPVVNGDHEIVGVLSEKDLLKVFSAAPGESSTVASLMTPDPVTIDVNESIVEVFDCLMANDFRRVLIHENGKLVGLVSRADLMPTILEVVLERAR